MQELILPPLLSGVCVDNPFETAVDQVRLRKAGAGDLFWSLDQEIATLAIILEPEVEVARALEMVPLALVALSDCLAVLLPPQVAVQFRQTDRVLVNGGVVGGVNAAMSATNVESETPDWLVLSIKVGLLRNKSDTEPGQQPDLTTLDEEGCEDCSRNKFIETYARHFLSWLVAWNDDGFTPIARAWKVKDENEVEPDFASIRNAISIFESTK